MRISSLYAKFAARGKVAPLRPGQTSIRIDLLPEECQRELIKPFKRKLQGPVKKAANQIKETKEAFNLKDAHGILLLVNEGNTFLRPEITYFLLHHILAGQYSSIDQIIYCSVNVSVVASGLPNGARFWSSATVPGRNKISNTFLKRLQYHWGSTIDRMIGLSGPIYTFSGDDALMTELVFEKPPIAERESFYVQPKKFYVCPDSGFKYYCDTVSAGTAQMFLVESYQHGELIQALFEQKLIDANARNYRVITDLEEIKRLKGVVKRLKRG